MVEQGRTESEVSATTESEVSNGAPMNWVATDTAVKWGSAPHIRNVCCHEVHRGAIGNFDICMILASAPGSLCQPFYKVSASLTTLADDDGRITRAVSQRDEVMLRGLTVQKFDPSQDDSRP
jgi:hypothetical protein